MRIFGSINKAYSDDILYPHAAETPVSAVEDQNEDCSGAFASKKHTNSRGRVKTKGEEGEDTESISMAQERVREGDGWPRFGELAEEGERTRTNRRNLSHREEDEKCPFDRTVERGGSRRELDRESGRGGDDTHRDSATARRDRGRGDRGRGR